MSSDDAKWFEELGQIVQTNPEFTEEYMRVLGTGMSYSGRTTFGRYADHRIANNSKHIKGSFFCDSRQGGHGHAHISCSEVL